MCLYISNLYIEERFNKIESKVPSKVGTLEYIMEWHYIIGISILLILVIVIHKDWIRKHITLEMLIWIFILFLAWLIPNTICSFYIGVAEIETLPSNAPLNIAYVLTTFYSKIGYLLANFTLVA